MNVQSTKPVAIYSCMQNKIISISCNSVYILWHLQKQICTLDSSIMDTGPDINSRRTMSAKMSQCPTEISLSRTKYPVEKCCTALPDMSTCTHGVVSSAKFHLHFLIYFIRNVHVRLFLIYEIIPWMCESYQIHGPGFAVWSPYCITPVVVVLLACWFL